MEPANQRISELNMQIVFVGVVFCALASICSCKSDCKLYPPCPSGGFDDKTCKCIPSDAGLDTDAQTDGG